MAAAHACSKSRTTTRQRSPGSLARFRWPGSSRKGRSVPSAERTLSTASPPAWHSSKGRSASGGAMNRPMATDNRWGDPPAGEMRRLSGIAVAAVIVSAWAMLSGMLLGLAPGLVASIFGQAVAAAIPLASFLGFLLGIGLSYAAL